MAIVDKIQKLLEMSNSSNEHEAALAAARAAELMVEYQISEAELAVKRGEPQTFEGFATELIEGDTGGKLTVWRSWVLDGLCQSTGGSAHRSRGSQLLATVQPSAMSTIHYMFAYLTRQIDELADEAYRNEVNKCSRSNEVNECRRSFVAPTGARVWKSAFRAGAALAIRNRLVTQRKTTIRHATYRASGQNMLGEVDGTLTQALAIIDRQDDALVAYQREHQTWRFKSDGSRRRVATSSAGSSSSSGFSAGRSAGESVSLGGGPRLGSGRGKPR